MSNILPLVTFLLIVFSFPSASFAKLPCNPHDKAALLAIKKAFPPAAFPSWGEAGLDCCFWGNVKCTKGRITSLIIHKNKDLKGSLPPAIGDLTALELISFDTLPNLVGPFPPQFSKLTSLQYLNVYVSGLAGPIPSYLSTFTGLKELGFIQCKFTGTIPPSIGYLANLFTIDFSGNQLTGPIPGTLFSKLSGSLQGDLDLSNNMLSGDIPTSLGKVQFQNINLVNNHLTGDASFLFGKSKPVTQILLANNSLSFDLTTVEYGASLEAVDMSHNLIYGTISSQINDAKSLGLFDVSYNNLCGKVPIGKLSQPQFGASSLAHNKCLCGTPLPPCKRKKLAS